MSNPDYDPPSHVGSRTSEDLDDLIAYCSNWGRWGADDELGTLNYVTPDILAAACGLVERGEIVSLAIPVGASGPQTGRLGRFNPQHLMLVSGADIAAGIPSESSFAYSDDMLILPLQSGTQWDALSHVFHEGRMWNGKPMELVGSTGALRNSIVAASSRFIGRGVLLDVATFREVDYLAPGEIIRTTELEAVAAAQGTRIEQGDFLLIRTGWLEEGRRRAWEGYLGPDRPGLALETAAWIHDLKVAAVASDTSAVEVNPSEIRDVSCPWHQVVIAHMGLTVGEIFDLGALSDACRRLGRFHFLLSAAGLPVTGGVGTPANPLAIL